MQQGDATEASLIGGVTTPAVRPEASVQEDHLHARRHDPCRVAQARLSRLYHAWEPQRRLIYRNFNIVKSVSQGSGASGNLAYPFYGSNRFLQLFYGFDDAALHSTRGSVAASMVPLF